MTAVPPESTPARPRFLLILLLSLLMALAGAHLLETVTYTLGMATGKQIPSAYRSFSTDRWEKDLFLTQAYRYFISLSCLFLGYHCLTLKDWARRMLVWVLTADLAIWAVWTVVAFFTIRQVDRSWESTLVQASVVLFELALLWFLLRPSIADNFQNDVPREERGRT